MPGDWTCHVGTSAHGHWPDSPCPTSHSKNNLGRHLRIEGLEQLARTPLERPTLFSQGIMAILNRHFRCRGFKLFSVARELDNPFLDQFVTEFRESRGQKILPKKGSA